MKMLVVFLFTLIAITFFFNAPLAYADNVQELDASLAELAIQDGKVLDVRVASGKLVPGTANETHFLLDGESRNRTACQSQTYWAIATNETPGKNILAVLLTAMVTDKAVTVWGNGECLNGERMERVQQILIK